MAAEVLAICMREYRPSCIRAPPLAENMISGSLCLSAYSVSLATFSPSTVPMLPIKKPASSTATAALYPCIFTTAVTTDSVAPVDALSLLSFSAYPGNAIGSLVSKLSQSSLQLPSSAMRASLSDGGIGR